MREESVDLVIGVDVSPAPPVRNIRHVYDVLVRTMEISGHHLIRCKNRDVDVLIQPNLNGVRSTLFVEDPERLLEGERGRLASASRDPEEDQEDKSFKKVKTETRGEPRELDQELPPGCVLRATRGLRPAHL